MKLLLNALKVAGFCLLAFQANAQVFDGVTEHCKCESCVCGPCGCGPTKSVVEKPSLFCSAERSSCFEGFYVGASLNYERFSSKSSEFEGPFPVQGLQNTSYRDNAAGFDLYAGYMARLGCSNWLIGIEPFLAPKFNKSSVSGSVIEVGNQEISDFKRRFDIGIGFRAGYLLCEETLIYGVVGPKVGLFKFQNIEIDPFLETQTTSSEDSWIPGIFYGVGVEHAFSCYTLGLQATMSNYAHRTITAVDENGSPNSIKTGPRVFTLAVRLSIPIF